MNDRQKSIKDLIAENKRLREMLASAESTHNATGRDDNPEHQIPQHDTKKHGLDNFALNLSSLPYNEIYACIVSQAVSMFCLKAATIFLYDNENSELIAQCSRFSGNSSLIEKKKENKFSNLKIHLNNSQIDTITGKSYHLFKVSDKTPDNPIQIAFKKLTGLLTGNDWLIEVGLSYRNTFAGVIVMIGPDNQVPPDHEVIQLFTGITSVAFNRKIAEEAFNESEARFRQMSNEAPAGYQLLDKKGIITEVNQAWLDTFGYERDDVVGKWIGSFLSEKSVIKFKDNLKSSSGPGKLRLELEVIHKSGNLISVVLVGWINNNTDSNSTHTYCFLTNITAQRQAELRVQEQEQMFEAIANYTANWESWFDNNGKIIWTNPAAFKFTGYTPEEIMSLPDYVEALVAEGDRARVKNALHEALNGKDASGVEFQCIRKDQSKFMISVTWNHIYDKAGKALGIRTSGQDITSYRKAEEDFTHSENLYRQMIDNAPFGMHFYQLDNDNRLIFTSANHAAGKILGINHKRLIGLPIEEAFPSLTGTEVVNHYLNAARNNKTWVTDQIVYQDKKISGAFEVKAFQTAPGRMVAIFTDITNRKKAEESLYESQQLFETLTRVSPVGIFRTNSEGATTFVNPKWTSLTGLNFEDAMGNKYLAAIHPDDRDERVNEWNIAVKSGKPVVSEYRFLRPDGSIIWVQGHAVPEIVDGRIKGYIGTITDITELKRAERELLQAKEKAEASNRLKTTFMGNISHEIRTPLNGIIGFAELISSGNNTPEENEECIAFLNQSINRLNKIIDNIMDLSLMMSGNAAVKKGPFRVESMINDIIKKHKINAARKNLELTVDNDGSLKGRTVNSDQLMISRILNELIDNAIKFTNHGSVSISCICSKNTLSLLVKDSGIGVSNEFLPFIFEPFVQEDVYSARVNNSNGLGLSIVYATVNLLGGNVHVESTPGAGTSILVNIPVIETITESTEGKQSGESGKKNKQPVIMIVEDEEINMIYLKRILHMKGYNLLFATNGPEAISYMVHGSHVDLILMDMKMPGMDGFETTRQIKSINPDVKIAAVTAYASEADRDACMEAGCDNYISKPFQKNDLYQLLKVMM